MALHCAKLSTISFIPIPACCPLSSSSRTNLASPPPCPRRDRLHQSVEQWHVTKWDPPGIKTWNKKNHAQRRSETAPCSTNWHICGKIMANISCYCSLLGQHLAQCCRSFLHCPGRVNTSTRTLHIAKFWAWHYHLQRQRALCWAEHN